MDMIAKSFWGIPAGSFWPRIGPGRSSAGPWPTRSSPIGGGRRDMGGNVPGAALLRCTCQIMSRCRRRVLRPQAHHPGRFSLWRWRASKALSAKIPGNSLLIYPTPGAATFDLISRFEAKPWNKTGGYYA